jgi:hypothetical protein
MNLNLVNEMYINKECFYTGVSLFNATVNNIKNKFSILHLNIRSLTANFDLLTNFLSCINYKFSIIALTEIKIDDSCHRLFNLKDYNHIDLYRNKHGGGIRIYFLAELAVSTISELTGVFESCEILSLMVTVKNVGSITITCIYRPPSCSKPQFVDFIANMLDNSYFLNVMSVLLGDWNMDYNSSLSIHRKFYDNLASKEYKILITLPTYINPSNLKPTSILDQFAVKTSIASESTIIDFKLTDHLPIACFLNFEPPQTFHDIKFRNFSAKQIDNFIIKSNEIFSTMPIDFRALDVNSATENFTNWCMYIAGKYFPICHKRLGSKRMKSPWLSKAALKCIDTRVKLYGLCKKNILYIDFFMIFDEILKRLLRMAKDEYYNNFFNNHRKSSKKTWSKINELVSDKKNHSSKFQLNIDNSLVVDSHKVANAFNNYFLSIPTELHNILSPSDRNYSYLVPNNTRSIYLYPVSSSEVYNVISSFNCNSSLSDIPIKMLKLSQHFSVGIAELFNHIISEGQYPDMLKMATVIPIHKTGSRSDIKNFRPISLLPTLDKIFEHLIYDRLLSFLNNCNTISDQQFGFVSGLNTNFAMFELLSVVIPALRDKEYAVAIFADLSRAFDCVSTKLLLHKLYLYGIRGVAFKLFQSFLSDRLQRVLVDSVLSDFGKVRMGVPQGSSLGPILFLLYINDLTNLFNNLFNNQIKCLLYADDTTLLCKGNEIDNVCSTLTNTMSIFSDWLKYNRLTLNVNKTKVMIFSNRLILERPIICVDFVPLDYVEKFKYLGIMFDSKVNYNHQISQVKSRLYMFYSISNKISKCFNLNAAKNFFYSHVYSSISYGIVIWGGWLGLSKYKSVSNKYIKIISNIFWRFSIPYHCNYCILKKHKILKLIDVYKLNILTIMYHAYNLPSHKFNKYIDKQTNNNYYNIRNAQEFVLPYFRINQVQYSFEYQSLTLWNELPQLLKNSKNIKIFKQHLIDYFVNVYCSHD